MKRIKQALNELSVEDQQALEKRDVLFDAAEDLEDTCPGVRVIIVFCEGPYVQCWNRSRYDEREMKGYLQKALERWDLHRKKTGEGL